LASTPSIRYGTRSKKRSLKKIIKVFGSIEIAVVYLQDKAEF
jgi:hypothetical protein